MSRLVGDSDSKQKKMNISVVCVTKYSDIPEEHCEMFRTLQDVCSKKGFDLKIRTFDSWKYSPDRSEITSLPAFHIYINQLYKRTIFPEDLPLERLEACVKEYEERLEGKKGSWIRNIISYPSIFRPRRSGGSSAPDTIVEWDNPMH